LICEGNEFSLILFLNIPDEFLNIIEKDIELNKISSSDGLVIINFQNSI